MRSLVAVSLLLAWAVSAAAEEPAPPEGSRLEVSLEDCIRMALEGNLGLRASAVAPGIERTRVQEADAAFDQLLTFRTRAGESDQPPVSQVLGSHTRTQSLDVATTRRLVTGASVSFGYQTVRNATDSFFATLNPSWTSAFYLTLSQPLLRGGWSEFNRSQIELAKRQRDAARDDLDAEVQDLLARVEAAYWDLVFAEAEVEVARASLGVAGEFLETVRRRIAAEKATRVQETEALTGVESRSLDVISAENALGNAQDALRALLRPFSETDREAVILVPVTPPGPVAVESELLPEEEAIAMALSHHPAIRSGRLALRGREIAVRQAENQTLPQLDLFGTGRLNALEGQLGETWEPLTGADHVEWEIGISLEVPFGNRAARSRLRRAELERTRERARLDQTTSDVVVGVRSAIRNVRSSVQSIEAAERARQYATQQLDNERERLKNGVSTPFQVLQVEQDLSGARSREVLARTRLHVALAQYYRAIGVLAEKRGVEPRALEVR